MIGTDASMQANFLSETEMPGIKVDTDQMQVICHRYYFASQFVSGKRVLEVGCGPGFGLSYLSRTAKCAIGGDVTMDSLKCAQEHYKSSRMELVSMDAHELPFRDGCFDVIVSVATIIYLDIHRFLYECRRVLKKKGMIILNTPNKNIPNFQRSRLSKNYFSIPELFEILKRYHFNAEFFGAFPVLETNTVKNVIKASGRNVLSVVPKGKVIRNFLGDILGGRNSMLTEIDEELIKNEEIKNIQLVPLPNDSADFQHRILYIVATKENE